MSSLDQAWKERLPSKVYLRTFGSLELEGAACSRPKSLLLLCYLALEGARDRRHLSGLFFSQAQDPLGSLRTTLRRLRREAPGAIEADGDPLQSSLSCDAPALLARLDAGDLEGAVGLYHGPFLAALPLSDGVELEEWVYETREYLAARVRGALLTLAERRAATGAFGEATVLAERALLLDGAPVPEHEDFERLNRLLVAGRSPRAPSLQQQAREFGLDLPLSVTAARQQLSGGPASFHPSLPERGTAFVGRAVERAELLRALARPEVRLLTVVGPGGTGKTRLALEVARDLQDQQVVAFAPLEAVAALRDLPGVIAHAVGLTLPDDQPPFAALLERLRGQPLLLVLDGVEHLLEGSPQVRQLLQSCPDLRLLLTSRARLGLEEEWVLTIGGLSLPGQDFGRAPGFERAQEAEAVQLFVQRARRASLRFELGPETLGAVVRIAELVGGSPLGIELAAAWVRLLPAQDIAAEVERSLDFLQAADPEVPARHQSVRAVFDQSWTRLPEHDRGVLTRLSVFRGGFTREAAGQVAGATLPVLARLLDQSLVRLTDGGRYDLHALILQFTQEQLTQDPLQAQRTVEEHGDFMQTLCQQAMRAFKAFDHEKQWSGRIERDMDNIRAALAGWLERGETETALRCLVVLRNFWWLGGHLREGRRWFSAALSSAGAVPEPLLISALTISGELAHDVGDNVEARRLLEEALALSERGGEAGPLLLLHLGRTVAEQGDLQAAQGFHERARQGFAATGQLQGVAASLNNLGDLLARAGDLQPALQVLEEALRVKRQVGSDTEVVLINLADVQQRLGQPDAAEALLWQALDGLLERHYLFYLPEVMNSLGQLALDRGRGCVGVTLLGAASALQEATQRGGPPDAERLERARAAGLLGGCPEADFDVAWASGRAMTLEQAVAYARRASQSV